MHRAYRFAIGYFALFGLLLLLSGGWLFAAKIGWTPGAVSLYYLGSETVTGKSAYGLLESAVPHLGAMGLFIMVAAHFVLFAPPKAKRRAVKIVVALFTAAATDIAAGTVVASGCGVCAWLKLFAFGSLMLLATSLLLVILYYAFWHNWSPRRHPR